MNSYKTSKFAAITSGKFTEFKKEEYHIMMNRINTINNIMTAKCRSLSLKPLGMNFSFGFEFIAIDSYLKKIEDFDKKARKDPLKKWWMNQKASEMASTFLPAILDKIDSVSLALSQHEKSELLQNKLMKYLQFELLQCALECKFTRPRAAPASVFPNTSFQYARSRLRKKLENVYFTESETNGMKANDRKKKEEWIKSIATKKTQHKHQYYKDKLKKQKQKKKHKQIQKQLQKRNGNRQISISSSITISESMVSNASNASSDAPIIDATNHNINIVPLNVPPPPPLLPPVNDMQHIEMKMPIFMPTNPKQSNGKQKENRYCSDCTMYSIQLSKVTEELERYKVSLGSTQIDLQQAIDEITEWKVRYNEYKDKYDKKSSELRRLQSQISSLVTNSSAPTGSTSISQEMSTSFRDRDDRMSISGGSSVNRYQFMMHQKDNTNSGEKLNSDMSQIMEQHLKHNSNSTEKMLEQLRSEHNDEMEYGLCQEEENILFPITSNNNIINHNNNNGVNHNNNGVNHNNGVNNNNNNNVPIHHQNYVHYQDSVQCGAMPNAQYDSMYQTTSNESIDDSAMLMNNDNGHIYNNWNGNHFHANPFPPQIDGHSLGI